MRGYWKFNNSLLKDVSFNNAIKKLVQDILNDDLTDNYRKKWEFFKYKVRYIAIKRSKELKNEKHKLETDLMYSLNLLLNKEHISLEELEVKNIQLQLDKFYLDLAKGAFIRSRAKWLGEGEKNTNYFFALEKRNVKRKSLTALNINGMPSKHPNQINEFALKLESYNFLQKSETKDCASFLGTIQTNIPLITEQISDLHVTLT